MTVVLDRCTDRTSDRVATMIADWPQAEAVLTRGASSVGGAGSGVGALAVSGFPLDGPGEDHGMGRRMAAAGYRLEHPTTLQVQTSARVRGRAEGGLADLLHSPARVRPRYAGTAAGVVGA